MFNEFSIQDPNDSNGCCCDMGQCGTAECEQMCNDEGGCDPNDCCYCMKALYETVVTQTRFRKRFLESEQGQNCTACGVCGCLGPCGAQCSAYCYYTSDGEYTGKCNNNGCCVCG